MSEVAQHEATATDAAPAPAGRRSSGRSHWWLLAPALALLAAILLVPLFQSLLTSLGAPGLTLDHYTALFTDGVTMTVLGRTVATAAIVTIVTLLLGYPYAYLMTRVGARTRNLLLIVALIPFWSSVMARNFAWIVLLQRDGPVERALAAIGIQGATFNGTVVGVTIAMSQVLLPFMVLPLFGTLGSIDRGLLRAAHGLGSSRLMAFWKIYWPLSRGGVVSGLILVFTLSLGFYVTPALLGSPQESLIAQLLAQRTTQLLDFAGAGALGILVLVSTLALVAWANRFGGTVSALGVASTGPAGAKS